MDRTAEQLFALAREAEHIVAGAYVYYQAAGAMIVSESPGWEVAYDPTTNADKPWIDDEGNRFATAEVCMR